MSQPRRLIRAIPVFFAITPPAEGRNPLTFRVRFEGLAPGDIVNIEGEEYVILGSTIRDPNIDTDVSVLKKDHDEELLAKTLLAYRSKPPASQLLKAENGEEGIIEFTVTDARELQWSYVYTIQGGPSDDPWETEALIRKEAGIQLAVGKKYAAFGWIQWRRFSGREFMRFNIQSVAEVLEE